MDVGAWGEEIFCSVRTEAPTISRSGYFQPEERKEYRDGLFTPLSVGGDGLPDPGLGVNGMAITYPRSDARVEGCTPFRPPIRCLPGAGMPAGRGLSRGCSLGPRTRNGGSLPCRRPRPCWSACWAGPDQDRYLVQLLDDGDRYVLRVSPTSAAGVIHQGALSASLTWSNGTSNGISLQFDRRQGAFVGGVPEAPAAGGFQRALLVLQEGANIQRIPVDFPPATGLSGQRAERLDFGVNAEILRAAQQKTGGISLAERQISAYPSRSIHEVVILAHVFLSLAFASLPRASGPET